MLRDIRVALRSFVREPGFAAVLVLTIAVGIGATTAIVSVVHAVMLKPLPYRDPSSLVRVLNRQSFPDMEDWIAQNQTVETFGGYNGWASDVLLGDAPERIQGAIVTGRLLPMMGLAPSAGRLITPEDNEKGGGDVVVLSHDFWTQRFAADANVIGTTLSMSGRPTTVVGIMPEGFRLPLVSAERSEELARAGVFLPLGPVAGVRDCLDKLRFWERCAEADIPAIPTYDELDALIDATGATRFVVKERFGAGGGARRRRGQRWQQKTLLKRMNRGVLRRASETYRFSRNSPQTDL